VGVKNNKRRLEMPNMEEGKPNKKEPRRLRCAECGTRLENNDKACPNCGSTKKTRGPIHFVRMAQVAIGLRLVTSAVHEIHMTPDSWTVLGLILSFIIPPLFYGIFSMLTICFWYKVLIWLGVAFIAYCLTRIYIVIKSLRFIADKASGKRKI
jgi:hypothetical protein